MQWPTASTTSSLLSTQKPDIDHKKHSIRTTLPVPGVFFPTKGVWERGQRRLAKERRQLLTSFPPPNQNQISVTDRLHGKSSYYYYSRLYQRHPQKLQLNRSLEKLNASSYPHHFHPSIHGDIFPPLLQHILLLLLHLFLCPRKL